jgi:hypothetical protein
MQATISKLNLETGVLVKEQGLGVPIDRPPLQTDRPFSFFPLLPSLLSQPDPLVVEHSYFSNCNLQERLVSPKSL